MATTASPWKRTRSEASTGWNASTAPAVASAMRPGSSIRISFRGTSSCVSTATTPGSARAASTSIRAIRADEYGLRTIRLCSIPGKLKSAA